MWVQLFVANLFVNHLVAEVLVQEMEVLVALVRGLTLFLEGVVLRLLQAHYSREFARRLLTFESLKGSVIRRVIEGTLAILGR